VCTNDLDFHYTELLVCSEAKVGGDKMFGFECSTASCSFFLLQKGSPREQYLGGGIEASWIHVGNTPILAPFHVVPLLPEEVVATTDVETKSKE
jgi:hypothetical protein